MVLMMVVELQRLELGGFFDELKPCFWCEYNGFCWCLNGVYFRLLQGDVDYKGM